jgi:eukaryotic-like serine/threonine-protein kinase
VAKDDTKAEAGGTPGRMDTLSDRSLLQHYQDGDQDAARELYARYARRLRGLARAQIAPDLTPWIDVEDLVQSVFGSFFRRASRGDYDVPAWFLLAVCQERLGEPAEAVAAYSACVALNPDFLDARLCRGKLYLARGDWSAAQGDFDRVIRELMGRRREGLPVQEALAHAHLRRAQAAQGLREYARAIADLDEAVRLKDDWAEAYALRAEVRERAGEPRAAQLADLDRALKPDSYHRPALDRNARVRALDHKARILEQTHGREREALEVLNKLVFSSPDPAPALVRRAYLFARMGECVAVYEDVAEFLKREPTPERHYQAACIFALNSRLIPADRRAALRELALAVRGGYGLGRLATDPDLEPLAREPEFRRLLAAVQALGLGGRGDNPPR